MLSRHLLLFGIALLGIGILLPTVMSASAYDVSVSPAIDTPPRDITYQSQTYTMDDLGRVDPGAEATVTANAPDGEDYVLLLYYVQDGEYEIVDQSRGTGQDSWTFATEFHDGEPYSPGSYIVVLQADGVNEAVAPLVVSQYRVDIDAPTEAPAGSTIDVEASLSAIDDRKSLDFVEVIITDGDAVLRESLAESGSNDYAATVDVGSLPAGDYTLYVVARGEGEAFDDRQEFLGVSDDQTLTVEAEPTGDDSTDEGGTDPGPPEPSQTETTTETTTYTPNENVTETPTDRTETTADTETETQTSTGSRSADAVTDEPTTSASTPTDRPADDRDVITPNTQSTDGSTSTQQPLSPLLVVVALGVVLAVLRHRA